jgi:hypothetical protein
MSRKQSTETKLRHSTADLRKAEEKLFLLAAKFQLSEKRLNIALDESAEWKKRFDVLLSKCTVKGDV